MQGRLRVLNWAITVGFGLLALLALWATSNDHSRGIIARVIFLTFIISNLMFYTVEPVLRPTIQPIFDMCIGIAAFAAWEYRRGWDVPVLIALATLSACASVAHSITQEAQYAWELTTNLIYVAECLVVSARGMYYAAVHPWMHRGGSVGQVAKPINPMAWLKGRH